MAQAFSSSSSTSTSSASTSSTSAAACPTSYYTGSQNTYEILCDYTVAGDNFAAQTPTYRHRVSIFVIIFNGININNNLDIFKFSVIGSSNINNFNNHRVIRNSNFNIINIINIFKLRISNIIFFNILNLLNLLDNFNVFRISFNLSVIRKSNIDLFNSFFNILNNSNIFFNIIYIISNFFNILDIFRLSIIRNSNIEVFNIFFNVFSVFNIFRATNNLLLIRIINNPDVFTLNSLAILNLSIIRNSNINISNNLIIIHFYFFGILNVLDTLRSVIITIIIIGIIINSLDIFNTIDVINRTVGNLNI
ncbi:hypothetical protein FANTH_3685 [Fusarium anthophilum]|uniref:Uncharacterized protein n=1 Tax=Fusarium anthophilum TaxID=48485 RepID=A0A8H4ZSL2_9HYPO|nr:hypothetical protein FANTH_3685 [Fusarium anthophilum]